MAIKTRTVNLTIPEALLKKVDALAKRNYTSRSDILREALLEKIRRREKEELDEWGDPVSENWKTIVDFRKINSRGVPAKEVARAMRELLDE